MLRHCERSDNVFRSQIRGEGFLPARLDFSRVCASVRERARACASVRECARAFAACLYSASLGKWMSTFSRPLMSCRDVVSRQVVSSLLVSRLVRLAASCHHVITFLPFSSHLISSHLSAAQLNSARLSSSPVTLVSFHVMLCR